MNASAPSGVTLPKDNGSFKYKDPHNGTEYTINDGTLNVETPRKSGMFLDVGNTRNNGDSVILYQWGSTNTNQKFVVQRGYIKVKDTL
ncbi:hypothetical protein OG204_04215 [Streptomyces sp. NBC_01387]|uniref:hypothetical protein n=1 Tax=unclassified Streptomyces TaxID=2593676 RepID=UPI0032447BA3